MIKPITIKECFENYDKLTEGDMNKLEVIIEKINNELKRKCINNKKDDMFICINVNKILGEELNGNYIRYIEKIYKEIGWKNVKLHHNMRSEQYFAFKY
jgi:predicted TIM-barrel fold metal-dependent hydrolase